MVLGSPQGVLQLFLGIFNENGDHFVITDVAPQIVDSATELGDVHERQIKLNQFLQVKSPQGFGTKHGFLYEHVFIEEELFPFGNFAFPVDVLHGIVDFLEAGVLDEIEQFEQLLLFLLLSPDEEISEANDGDVGEQSEPVDVDWERHLQVLGLQGQGKVSILRDTHPGLQDEVRLQFEPEKHILNAPILTRVVLEGRDYGRGHEKGQILGDLILQLGGESHHVSMQQKAEFSFQLVGQLKLSLEREGDIELILQNEVEVVGGEFVQLVAHSRLEIRP